MLVRVAIDPEVGEELARGEKPPGPLVIRRIAERCVIVAESETAARELLTSFSTVPAVELRELVLEMVKSRLDICQGDSRPPPVPLREIAHGEQARTWLALADLLLMSRFRAEQLGLEDHVEPEAATFREALNAAAFAHSEEKWSQVVPAGTGRDSVWDAVFRPLAARAAHIYLIDRYLGRQLHTAVTAPTPGTDRCGAEWMLRRLAKVPNTTVHVATSAREIVHRGLSAEEVHERLASWYSSLSDDADLDLRLVPYDFPHGRRLAFDGWAGFELHNGAASLEPSRLAEDLPLYASRKFADQIRSEFRSLA